MVQPFCVTLRTKREKTSPVIGPQPGHCPCAQLILQPRRSRLPENKKLMQSQDQGETGSSSDFAVPPRALSGAPVSKSQNPCQGLSCVLQSPEDDKQRRGSSCALLQLSPPAVAPHSRVGASQGHQEPLGTPPQVYDGQSDIKDSRGQDWASGNTERDILRLLGLCSALVC